MLTKILNILRILSILRITTALKSVCFLLQAVYITFIVKK